MGIKELFQQHLQILEAGLETQLKDMPIDGLVISSGTPGFFTEDDQSLPFRSYHYFRHWCPMEGPQHVLRLVPGEKPELRIYQPRDFWHESKAFEPEFWGHAFSVSIVEDAALLWQGLLSGKTLAYQGHDKENAAKAGLLIDVPGLSKRLDWLRLHKTPYEVQELSEANRRAAAGHRVAERVFRQGGSELDIHLAYLGAVRCQEQDLPYESIVALNEKAATLHYGAKRDEVHNAKVLLIDAGASIRGYGSDITRTYATEDAPEEFQRLLAGMTVLQAGLVDAIKPGMPMPELHHLAHQRIAELLLAEGIIQGCDVGTALELGLSRAFFPHGLGHMLGLFVHDVGGHQADRLGNSLPKPTLYPKLRTSRPLDPGTVVTIEPGLYFIDMLLEPWRQHAQKHLINWSLVEKLKPFGGIRIEDDILIEESGSRNLTREHLP